MNNFTTSREICQKALRHQMSRNSRVNNLTTVGPTTTIGGALSVATHITASGNISASGNFNTVINSLSSTGAQLKLQNNNTVC